MLQKIRIQPGFNKQVTATGGEGQWVGGDYVRFRYGSPEKIGGWAQLGSITLTGRNTALHHFVNSDGIKYAALGTNRILYAYSGGAFMILLLLKVQLQYLALLQQQMVMQQLLLHFHLLIIFLKVILFFVIILALLPILILPLVILTTLFFKWQLFQLPQLLPLKWDPMNQDQEHLHLEL